MEYLRETEKNGYAVDRFTVYVSRVCTYNAMVAGNEE
jgi:hypothetical protein